MVEMNVPRKQGLYDPQFEHDSCGVGFLVHLKGQASHQIVDNAIEILLNLQHRGACGCEENTGDGAGILLQTPHAFLAKECENLKIALPKRGDYGVGMLFLPTVAEERKHCEQLIEQIVREEGQQLLGWRDVPTDNSDLGPTARRAEPTICQVFIGRGKPESLFGGRADIDGLAFERKLYVIRRRIENAVRNSRLTQREMFYIPSFSSNTIVYKGMLKSDQVTQFYPDLVDPTMETALAMVHSRFSTNTFPNWARAHPNRYMAHNGEINTLRGNVNWMFARQSMFQSELFGDDIHKVFPVIDPEGSDSGMFDNAFEMLAITGRSLPHAAMMMIPEPWTSDDRMSPEKRAFYEYHACLMEPWDGPASIAFTDGKQIGAVLDRNGLRPSRYYVTSDDLVIMASEVGVLEVPPEKVVLKGRLKPGRMFLVDIEEGRIIADDELKAKMATERPYQKWLDDNLVSLESIPNGHKEKPTDLKTLRQRQRAFGYTFEDLKILMTPMGETGREGTGSMGNDAALAVLSERPQMLYNYFKQLFAQVTNPPVDAIREEIIMSMESTTGREFNLLQPTAESCRQIHLKSTILTNGELEKIRHLEENTKGKFKSVTLPILFDPTKGEAGLLDAMETLCQQASQAIADGNELIVLSDRGICREEAAIPALLAVAGVHHHLIREGARTHVGLILESGEPREVHQFALLIGYGAGAINPYLAYETLEDMINQGLITAVDDPQKAGKLFVKAVNKGVLKIMSKMGISTVQSYCGAQIFEAVGLNQEVIDRYFTWTPSRISGIGFDTIAKEAIERHYKGYPDRPTNGHTLDVGGHYQYRKDGEYHLFNPESVHKLQNAVRTGNYNVYREYSELINNQAKNLCTLRGLFQFKFAANPIPIEEVEPIENIMQRFKSGAMSYGSISKEAHETLAIGMNRVGGKSNTGEGGEDPERFIPLPNGDSKNSAIKQVASGRFGVTSEYLVNSKELQIKMAQGAKPGEGGQLPGPKVYPWIAKVRNSTPGVGLISPPPHHDIYSIEDLAELIHDLKNANRHARVSVKLVSEVGVGTIAAGVSKAHADVVLISGQDGGTGASPLTSIKHAGAPWELGLAETHQTLVLNDLRSRIYVEVDGQLKTGRDVVIGALLGAEEFGFATAPLVAMGCIMMRVCHLNTCPVGVATQNPELRKRFPGDPDHVVNFMEFVAMEVRELMAQLGIRKFDDLVGRTDLLEVSEAIAHYKAKGLDLSPILYQPVVPDNVGRYRQKDQDHGLDVSLDMTTLLSICQPAIERGEAVEATIPIRNVHRVVGTIVGSEITRKHGAAGLPEDTIRLHFQGSAGQSFAAFVPKGMTMTLEGDANDYFGKGLSGGKVAVYPPKNATFVDYDNVIIGNVAFYGATAGEAYIAGLAGERFCVRNSGVHAVVLQVGDHCCEYMTGGRVVVLGGTGRNFAAGMSGGLAYVLDETGDFERRCNLEMVDLLSLDDPEEIGEIREMIRNHANYTDSPRSHEVLARWEEFVPKFVKVYPKDFRRVIETQERLRAEGLPEDEVIMTAFEENARDVARAAGN
ncbi:MAG: glutamate synthase large subunit [Gemmataceae bacterium]